MRIKAFSAALTAGALVATPLAAQADRSSAPASDESEMGGSSRLLVLLVVAAAIFAGIELTDDDGPVSP